MNYKLSLSGRLSLLFSAVFAAVVVLGLASAWSLSHSNEVYTDVRDRWLPNVRLLGDLNNFTSDYRTAEANSLLAGSPEELANSLQEIRSLDQAVIRAQRDYEQIPHGSDETSLYEEFRTTWELYKTLADRVTALSSAGQTAEGVAIYRTKSRTTYDTASNLLGRLTDYNVRAAALASERSAAAFDQARWLVAVSLTAAGLMLAVVIAQIRRQISSPLLSLSRDMHALAANDTGFAISHTNRKDEIGEMARAVVVFRSNAIDLTHSQRGLAQQATMLEEKLELEQSVTQMQRNFVSMITHEFRTPLTQIDAQAQRLTNMRDRLLPDDIADRARKIRLAVTRIVRMIDQLVATTQLMDGDTRLFFHPEPIDLVAVLRKVCRSHREISPDALITEYYDEKYYQTKGDAKLLFQAFSNILSNAIKYSPCSPRVELRFGRNSGRLTISIEDNGIGIPVADQENIFSRYYRGSNVSGFVGTGVGLFLVATVLRLHSGEIAFRSTEGSGTRFTATLPDMPEAPPVAPERQ